MIARFIRDHNVAHFQGWSEAACGTGVNNDVRLAAFKQQRSAQRRRHFTNTGFQQRNVGSVKLTGVNFTTAQGESLTVFDFVTQQRNLFFHCTNDADFHRFTRAR